MPLQPKNRLVIFLAIALGVVGLLFFYSAVHGRQTLVINFKNVSGATIEPYTQADKPDTKKSPKKLDLSKSGEALKFKKGLYIISYSGGQDYANGSVSVDLSAGKNVITINPYYSETKLESLLNNEFGPIKSSLANQYQNLSQYELQRGQLYRFGDWYGTTLVYTGQDIFNSDTLRVALHKVNGTWTVATDPPNILLTTVLYPDVPKDILESVNSLK